MHRTIKLAVASLTLALGATAAAAAPHLQVVGQPAERFERSIETHKLVLRYTEAIADARRLGVAADAELLDDDRVSSARLRRGVELVNGRIEREREQRRAEAAAFELVGGVSQTTLDSIAACESGGDPTAVDASGTYFGKYQFDTATWASVGGSGSPAEASAAEQDHRASLLYSRAGSSPWPVCG